MNWSYESWWFSFYGPHGKWDELGGNETIGPNYARNSQLTLTVTLRLTASPTPLSAVQMYNPAVLLCTLYTVSKLPFSNWRPFVTGRWSYTVHTDVSNNVDWKVNDITCSGIFNGRRGQPTIPCTPCCWQIFIGPCWGQHILISAYYNMHWLKCACLAHFSFQ